MSIQDLRRDRRYHPSSGRKAVEIGSAACQGVLRLWPERKGVNVPSERSPPEGGFWIAWKPITSIQIKLETNYIEQSVVDLMDKQQIPTRSKFVNFHSGWRNAFSNTNHYPQGGFVSTFVELDEKISGWPTYIRIKPSWWPYARWEYRHTVGFSGPTEFAPSKVKTSALASYQFTYLI